MRRSDALQKGEKVMRRRQHASVSCTECRRRKQKCNQAKDRPCNNCARRYPPVECIYENTRNPSISIEKLIQFQPKFEWPGRTNYVVEGGFLQVNDSGLETNSENDKQNQLAPRIPSISDLLSSSTHSDTQRKSSPHDDADYEETRALSPIIKEDPQSHNGSNYDISKIFLVDTRKPYHYSFLGNRKESSCGSIRQHVGNTTIEPLNSLPIEVSMRNAELLHFFIQRLSPYMTAIDGNDPPASFNNKWLPFMIQSPLLAYIAILSASYFQAVARRIDVEKSVDAIAARVKLITLINEHITSHSKGVNDEAIAAVMSLSYNELIYSDKRSVLAHMSGLRSMVRTRGGIENIQVETLRKLILRTDYQVACTFECDPFICDSLDIPVSDPGSYPLQLDNPLLKSSTSFEDSAETLNISIEAARVLDDIRFLTTSIYSLNSNIHSQEEITKFSKTVHWIHGRLSCPIDLALAHDFFYQTCRTAAIIYTSTIISRTALSISCTAQLLQQIWMTMWRVPLPRWKHTPGIFLWTLLVVNPFAKDKPEGRFIKGMIGASIIGIGLEDWNTILATMKGFIAVQKWLGNVPSEQERGISNRVAVSQPPTGGVPAWAIRDE